MAKTHQGSKNFGGSIIIMMLSPQETEKKDMQEIYMTVRVVHEELAKIQALADKHNLPLEGYPELSLIQETLRTCHNMARIREDNPTSEEEGITA